MFSLSDQVPATVAGRDAQNWPGKIKTNNLFQ
jgi:hypothetical protein